MSRWLQYLAAVVVSFSMGILGFVVGFGFVLASGIGGYDDLINNLLGGIVGFILVTIWSAWIMAKEIE